MKDLNISRTEYFIAYIETKRKAIKESMNEIK